MDIPNKSFMSGAKFQKKAQYVDYPIYAMQKSKQTYIKRKYFTAKLNNVLLKLAQYVCIDKKKIFFINNSQ